MVRGNPDCGPVLGWVHTPHPCRCPQPSPLSGEPCPLSGSSVSPAQAREGGLSSPAQDGAQRRLACPRGPHAVVSPGPLGLGQGHASCHLCPSIHRQPCPSAAALHAVG